MSTWFTADLHLGHARIAGLAGRPYGDVDAMNRDLIARWNGLVSPDDEVWVLGDVAMGRIEESLALVRSLVGQKILVPGNHDRCWVGRGDEAFAWRERYLAAGFAQIVDAPCRLRVGRREWLLDHFPYVGDRTGTERYPEARPVDSGDWLLHGHTHGSWRQRGRMVDVGVDAWGGYPVSGAVLDALVGAGRDADLGPLAWV